MQQPSSAPVAAGPITTCVFAQRDGRPIYSAYRMQLTVVEAEHLPDLNTFQPGSDTFCTVQVVETSPPAAPFATAVVRQTSAPRWNHAFHIVLSPAPELDVLVVTVHAERALRNAPVGLVYIPVALLQHGFCTDAWFRLLPAGGSRLPPGAKIRLVLQFYHDPAATVVAHAHAGFATAPAVAPLGPPSGSLPRGVAAVPVPPQVLAHLPQQPPLRQPLPSSGYPTLGSSPPAPASMFAQYPGVAVPPAAAGAVQQQPTHHAPPQVARPGAAYAHMTSNYPAMFREEDMPVIDRSPPVSRPLDRVVCPVCSRSFVAGEVEAHVNSCLEESEQRDRESHARGGGGGGGGDDSDSFLMIPGIGSPDPFCTL
jgi:hypothetical protein